MNTLRGSILAGFVLALAVLMMVGRGCEMAHEVDMTRIENGYRQVVSDRGTILWLPRECEEQKGATYR